jgi:hypothetical protein
LKWSKSDNFEALKIYRASAEKEWKATNEITVQLAGLRQVIIQQKGGLAMHAKPPFLSFISE